MAFLGYLFTLASANDAEGLVKTSEKASIFEPEPSLDGSAVVKKTLSIKEYDISQVFKALQKAALGIASRRIVSTGAAQ